MGPGRGVWGVLVPPPRLGNFPLSLPPFLPKIGGDGGEDSPSGRRVPVVATFPARIEREQKCETEIERELAILRSERARHHNSATS